jgi:5-methylcytosine-specific restriction endonuclease McrA
MSTPNLFASEFNQKERAQMRREVLSDLAERKVKSRCMSIFRHQVEKALKLKIAPPDYKQDQLIAMARAALGTVCRYCDKKITAANFSFDHEMPLDRGGAMTIANLAVIEASCNSKKGKLTAGEFQSLLTFLKSFPPTAVGDVLTRLGIGGRWKH